MVTNPDAQFDDHPSTATGPSVAGAAVGALIGALLTGGKPASGVTGAVGQPVAELQSLIGGARRQLCGRAQHPEPLPVLHLRQSLQLQLTAFHLAAGLATRMVLRSGPCSSSEKLWWPLISQSLPCSSRMGRRSVV